MGVSGGEVQPELRKWLGGPGAARSCCSAATVVHVADSLTVYYNDSCLTLFFPWIIEKAWSMGGELHSLSIYSWCLSQPTSSPQSPHLSDVRNTFFCPILSYHDFNSEILRLNRGMGLLLTCSVASAGTDRLLYLHLKPKQFSSTQKGQKWGKVDISSSLSLSLSLPFFLLLPLPQSHWYCSAKGEMKRVIEREVGIQYKARGGMRESERWKTKRARGVETTGWES